MSLNGWTVAAIVLVTAIVVKLEGILENRKSRKIQAYTLMTMMNDLATLAPKCGYSSWIEYLKATYGMDNTTLYVTQIYNALYRSKIKGEQIDAAKAALKKYLQSVPRVKDDSASEGIAGRLKEVLEKQNPRDQEQLPLGLQFLPKKRKKSSTESQNTTTDEKQ